MHIKHEELSTWEGMSAMHYTKFLLKNYEYLLQVCFHKLVQGFDLTPTKVDVDSYVHPRPYKLSWLHDKHEVHVLHRCSLSIQLKDKVFDNVLCNVVEMKISDVILG